MDKNRLGELMREIDEVSLMIKRQRVADNYALEAVHEMFNDVLEDSLYNLAILNGMNVDRNQTKILEAELINEEEDW